MRGQTEGRESGLLGRPLKAVEILHFADTNRRLAAAEYRKPSKWTETGALK